MKNSLQKIAMAFSAILFVLVATPGVLHAGGMGYASAAQDSANQSAHASQTTLSVDTVSAHTNTQCLALCQTDSTTRPSVTLPASEEEDDDVFDELIGEHAATAHCSLSIATTAHALRSPKIPLYLKYCRLIL